MTTFHLRVRSIKLQSTIRPRTTHQVSRLLTTINITSSKLKPAASYLSNARQRNPKKRWWCGRMPAKTARRVLSKLNLIIMFAPKQYSSSNSLNFSLNCHRRPQWWRPCGSKKSTRETARLSIIVRPDEYFQRARLKKW